MRHGHLCLNCGATWEHVDEVESQHVCGRCGRHCFARYYWDTVSPWSGESGECDRVVREVSEYEDVDRRVRARRRRLGFRIYDAAPYNRSGV
jgi:hypothetical protein